MVRDLYGTGIGVDMPITYTVPLNHFTGTTIFSATPFVGTNTWSVGPRSTFSLQTAHSTMVPHVPTILVGNAVVSQVAIGTPITPRTSSSLPFGYKALNSSATTTTQVMLGSSIPTQQPGGISLGGINPLSGTGQSITFGSQILGTLPQAGGILPLEENFHLEGTLMMGRNLNPEPTINRMDKMCLPHPIRRISLFQETHSSRRDTILKLCNNLFPLKGLIYILLMDKR
jgi:hypothetical protein